MFGRGPSRAFPLALALVLSLGACASGAGSGGSTGGDPDRITAEELSEVSVSTALEVVRQLRPRWLRTRDVREPVRVVVNGSPRGEATDELARLQISRVREMRFLDTREATTRYGRGFGAGVIEVTTR